MVLQELNFSQSLLWEGVVLLKELILYSFYFGRVWWSLKELIFNSFYFGQGVVVLKELIFNSF